MSAIIMTRGRTIVRLIPWASVAHIAISKRGVVIVTNSRDPSYGRIILASKEAELFKAALAWHTGDTAVDLTVDLDGPAPAPAPPVKVPAVLAVARSLTADHTKREKWVTEANWLDLVIELLAVVGQDQPVEAILDNVEAWVENTRVTVGPF